jgi:hypothetical protein
MGYNPHNCSFENRLPASPELRAHAGIAHFKAAKSKPDNHCHRVSYS